MVGCSARAIAIYRFVQAVNLLGNLVDLQVCLKYKSASLESSISSASSRILGIEIEFDPLPFTTLLFESMGFSA